MKLVRATNLWECWKRVCSRLFCCSTLLGNEGLAGAKGRADLFGFI